MVVDRVTLKLEVLTPLFMGGAHQDQRSSVDAFRIPSLRGLARFWFRALMGGVISNAQDNLERVRQLESEVFGSTEQASAVQFRLLNSPQHPECKVKGEGGIRYLAFSLRNRVGVSPGDKIEVAVECRPGAKEAQNRLFLALGAFWLLANLGGLGSRSRRGFGSVVVVSAEPEIPPALPPFPVRDRNSKELASSLAGGLGKLWGLYSQYAARKPSSKTSYWEGTTLPEYDILAKGVARVRVASFCNTSDWKDVLDKLGQKLRECRRPTNVQQPQIFGLPSPGYKNRRASPLLFKVVRFCTGKYGAVLTLFKAEFLPGVRRGNWDYKVLDKFLDDVDGDEVPLP